MSTRDDDTQHSRAADRLRETARKLVEIERQYRDQPSALGGEVPAIRALGAAGAALEVAAVDFADQLTPEWRRVVERQRAPRAEHVTGDEAARAAMAETQRRARVAQQLRRERWGEGSGAERMARLARRFPCMVAAAGVDPWDAIELMRWGLSGAMTGGSKHVVRFLLQVWNPSTDWRAVAVERGVCSAEALTAPDHPLAPFNAVEAIAVWDFPHVDAFRAWCEAPFQP